jgi:hypothetical protein
MPNARKLSSFYLVRKCLPNCHCEPLQNLIIICYLEWRGNLPLILYKPMGKIATPVCGLVRNDTGVVKQIIFIHP